ncbi:hypothetical protein [Phycisphaera mikurensis]|uniref:Uncharacterized protein n=1 Tax=Phycisphaera mikurensis (strain NBRC 102666 / KCTC 22515 / FYK2301M01) TaxID=1142394 RepID=I0IHG2_PHYMF|nr:hypothetical protein [Phycisphaera mikurensis]MBB6440947.1 hypothetical protein [Phycisphaera mikurensis]BAM04700.1 hypothetical protein PSMK_25410 [Phycisphaera mikurensis NBRC 102666]
MANDKDDPQKLLKLGAVAVVGGIAAVLLAVNLLGSDRGPSDQKWMLDLETQIVHARPVDTRSPAAEGGAGVRSYPQIGEGSSLVDVTLLTCGDPGDITNGMSVDELAGVEARVGWVSIRKEGDATGGSELVSDATGANWGPKMSPENIQMMEAAAGGCPDGSAVGVVAGP